MFNVWKNHSRKYSEKQNLISVVLLRLEKRITNTLFPLKCLKCHCFINTQNLYQNPYMAGGNADKSADYHDVDAVSALFSELLCQNCLKQDLVLFDPPFCIKCGRKFNTDEKEGHVCGECLKSRTGIGKVRAFAMYQGWIRDGIHLLKYQKKQQLAGPFEQLLFSAFERYFSIETYDLVLPVPLHWLKMMKRGFNQSFVIISGFEKIWKAKYKRVPPWHVDPELLQRKKNTDSQTGFDREQRKQNLKKAFKVKSPEKIKNKRILLVDDVYTTGATAKEAALVLFAAGAAAVDVLVLARA